ncbi:unnamed protein product [Bursaphelenchus okinawaensis]|uniref:Vacuolar protein sorting-associated protein 35 n=1 Tax=Bursaphelenchus okinawaensis TaxID=465554 RepID=A0A811K7Y5_9BILA|nr:unnamed protein product [Bursaphelenchus okinawaensis]CAG9095159.1 unnamed protein product [Bursaphelenchus okinawaensis]
METEQEVALEEMLRLVKAHAFEMKRSLDKKDIRDGLRHVNNMLNELRTPALSPKFYYRLYIDVTNELQHFLSYLTDEYLVEGENKVTELYELVQFAAHIVPRLYLMITVGVAYIKSKEAPCKDILKDMVEMCRGVQHPIKGLFLRNYLLSSTKELLPICAPGENDGEGNINDSLEIVMTNFSEMNKLWVRMQHQGPSREREKREKERRELRILVGTNLVRLSQLELLDLEMYKTLLLPGILEQSVSCREPISQEYLMECVIQVFPDEFHLATLSEFLGACLSLHPNVQIKNVLCAVIERLIEFSLLNDNQDLPKEHKLFEVFSEHCEKIISTREEMLPEDIVTIQRALVNLAIKCYPAKTEYANTVFASTASIFERLNEKNIPPNKSVGKELIKLLKMPIDCYSNCLTLLELDSYKTVLNLLSTRGQTNVCSAIIKAIIEKEIYITEEEQLEKLFYVLEILLIPQEDEQKDQENIDEFEEHMELVAALVHSIKNDNPEVHMKFLSKIRKVFGKGGSQRIAFTLPPLIFSTFALTPAYTEAVKETEDSNQKVIKLFQFCQNTINALKAETDSYEACLNILLQGALVADKTDFEDSETVAYEFISNAFTIFEEDLTESRVQAHCLSQMIGTVQALHNVKEENHETLRNQCAMYASKLLKKADQAKALCSASHLFWFSRPKDCEEPIKNGKRLSECLKKALKVTSQCMEDQVQLGLYVLILTNYVYFYELCCDTIDGITISKMIDKIRDSLQQVDPSTNAELLTETFNNILQKASTLKRSDSDDLAKLLGSL